MKKWKVFLLFIVIVSTLVLSVISYLQSGHFARFLKKIVSHSLPQRIGIEGDFSELSFKFFPPGFSIKNPHLKLSNKNILKLPGGSSLNAKQVSLRFLPFQILTGDIRIHEISIQDGNIDLILDLQGKEKQTTRSIKNSFQWDELLQIRAESIVLENMLVQVKALHSPLAIQAIAKKIQFGQWAGKGGIGYELDLDLFKIHGTYLKELLGVESLDRMYGYAYANYLGLQLESLIIKHDEMELNASGQMKGNLIKPKDLLADVSLELKADLDQLVRLLKPKTESNDLPQGQILYKGTFRGKLDQIFQTLYAEGSLDVKDFSYLGWKFNRAKIDALLDASSEGGEIHLKKALLESPEVKRKGPLQPGSGGVVEVGPMKWKMNSTSPLEFDIQLSKAHLHWLVGPYFKTIYALDSRVNGKTKIKMILPFLHKESQSLGKAWQIEAILDNYLEPFQMDNQKYKKDSPIKKIFYIPKINGKGAILVNKDGIFPKNVSVFLPHSQVFVNGLISLQGAFDLKAEGSIDASDLGQIAENDCKGKGTVAITVKGPSSEVIVDIQPQIEDAFFLNLALGDVKGQVIWDDQPSILRIKNIKFKKSNLEYQATGKLNFKDQNTIDLDIEVEKGDFSEATLVLSKLIAPIPKYPYNLTGNISGSIKIQGELEFDKMSILAKVYGTKWDYFKERFNKVYIEGGLDKGSYIVTDFRALKKTGQIFGKMTYSPAKSDYLEWDFYSKGFPLTDFDRIAQFDVPIRGNLDFYTAGKGKISDLEYFLESDLSQLTIRGVQYEPSHILIDQKNKKFTFQSLILGEQGQIDYRSSSDSSAINYLKASFKKFDLTPFLFLLNSKNIFQESLNSYFSGSIDLNFKKDGLSSSNGSVQFQDLVLSRSNYLLKMPEPVSVKVQNGSFNLTEFKLEDSLGRLILNLEGQKNSLNGNVTGKLDASITDIASPVLEQVEGFYEFALKIKGAFFAPIVEGAIKLDHINVHLNSFESPIENLVGNLEIKNKELIFKDWKAILGGGVLSLGGRIDMSPANGAKVRLNLDLLDSKIKFFPFQFAKVKAKLDITGQETPYIVQGKVKIDSALSTEKILNKTKKRTEVKSLQYAPEAILSNESGKSVFKLDILAQAAGSVMIQNDLLRDVELKGDLNITNTIESPKISGEAEVIKGKILFKDHEFQIQNATAQFDNSPIPLLDLNASTEVNNVKIKLFVFGKGDKTKIEFTSNPSMQESDILSLLALGMTSTDTKKFNASDINAVQQGEAASLVLHSLGFNKELEEKTGFQVQVEETVNSQQGVSAFKPQGMGTEGLTVPQVVIRRKITNRLSFGAGSAFSGVASSKSNQFFLDYSLNPNLSLSGIFNNYGSYTSTTPNSNSATEVRTGSDSYGVDLKFQKRFK